MIHNKNPICGYKKITNQNKFLLNNLFFVVLLGKLEERRPRGDLGIDGWIILGWISRRWDVGIWTGFGRPRIETGGGRL